MSSPNEVVEPQSLPPIEQLKQKLRQILDKQQQNATQDLWRPGAEWGLNPDYYTQEAAHQETDQALLDFIADPEVTHLFAAIEKYYA